MADALHATEPPTDRFEARRAEIVAAALRVIERDGLAATTVRAIAREMGCTTGVLSHHFRTKDDLTALAGNEVTRAIASRITAAELTGSPERQLRNVALAFLPDDAASNRAWVVWLHFLTAALKQPEQLGRHGRATEAVRRHLRELLEAFRDQGLVGPDLDPEFEAAYLFALLDGLGVDALISPTVYGPHSFATFVTTHLTRLLDANQPTAGATDDH
ncbi:MAG: TetR family transcriptional regulator C-terminal domain-containing protein [Actinomycetota bacterium]